MCETQIIQRFSSSLSQALDLVASYRCQPILVKTITTFDCQQLVFYAPHTESQTGILNAYNEDKEM